MLFEKLREDKGGTIGALLGLLMFLIIIALALAELGYLDFSSLISDFKGFLGV